MTELGLRTIPGYVIHQLLETDLIGVTYLAERQADGYPVLLHVVHEELADDHAAASYRAALERVADIGHPVVPAVEDVGFNDGVLYSVTAAVEGRSVASTLANGRQLSPVAVRRICSELADALDILHAADVIHGAVNPHTVWINDRHVAPSAPEVTLRGFGSAVLLSHHVTVDREAPPPDDVLYVAPEQVRREELTGRVDQYALACMVVHCLTGAPPFDRATVNALFGAHLFAAPRTLEPRWRQIEPPVADALLRALAKDPADRFPTCGAFATAIGGDASRSWTWMLEEALGLSSADDASAPDPATDEHEQGARPAVTASRQPAADRPEPSSAEPAAAAWTAAGTPEPPSEVRSRAAQELRNPARPTAAPGSRPRRRLTAQALAQVDWLPGGSDDQPNAPEDSENEPPQLFSSAAAARWNLDTRQWRKVIIAGAALALLIALALYATRPPAAEEQPRVSGQQPSAAGVEPAWQRTIGSQGATTLTHTGSSVISGAGDVLSTFDRATGKQRWRTRVDGQVAQIAASDGTVVARTGQALYGFDEQTGQRLWDTTRDARPWATMAVGRSHVYAVATADEGTRLIITAIVPGTGAVAWVRNDLQTTPGATTTAVFDRSRLGGQMLYVLHGGRLHAIDTREQRQDWHSDLDRPHSESLTAIARAILVINEDGKICRYGMQRGEAVWTACALLDNSEATQSVINTRNGRVIISSAHEVAAVDFTSGTTRWQVTEDAGFQAASAANEDTAFVVHADGAVAAIAHHDGRRQWRSEPLGTVTAMVADADGVYVATADGRLTRLPARG